MDVVYILGTGSKWNDNEIRYSLRSLEKHFPHGRVFIVGELPTWLRNVTHLNVGDQQPATAGNKLRNALKKIRAACEHDEISDQFVLMNDNFFFLKDTQEILPYSLGTIQQTLDAHRTKKGYYYDALVRTQKFLQEKGIAHPISYGVHYPFVYDKKKFLEMTGEVETVGRELSLRTIYGNVFQIGSVERTDTKVDSFDELREDLQYGAGDFLSINDSLARYTRFQQWIDERFPTQSKYEQKMTDRYALSRPK